MRRKIGLLTSILIMIGLVWGSQPGQFSLVNAASSGVALAAENPPGKIFLPVVDKRSPYRNVFGIDFGTIYESRGVTAFSEANAHWVRRGEFSWADIEPVEGGVRRWDLLAGLETELLNAQQAGMRVILPVADAPQWARKYPDLPCGPIDSDYFDDFADFLHALVKRYSQPPYNLKYYEIWNEPDAPIRDRDKDLKYGCWIEDLDKNGIYNVTFNEAKKAGENYGEMLKAVYPAIKAADPTARVVLGGLLLDCDPGNPPDGQTCAATTFFEGLLASGAADYFDLVSFHSYDFHNVTYDLIGNPNWNGNVFNGPEATVRAKVNYLRDQMKRYNVPAKPIISTELALLPVCWDVENNKSKECTETEVIRRNGGVGFEGQHLVQQPGNLAQLGPALC